MRQVTEFVRHRLGMLAIEHAIFGERDDDPHEEVFEYSPDLSFGGAGQAEKHLSNHPARHDMLVP